MSIEKVAVVGAGQMGRGIAQVFATAGKSVIVVDINDAQLTYDIYTGKYTDFEKVSVRKFLRADTNADKVVNSADAVVVVANSK